ncbi:MAG: tetratricopeptide repeat protein, partial [Saprospiraceae bacterium]
MTKFTIFFINLLLLASLNSDAQLFQDDNNILFMQANVLYNTDRYDEAVRMYNRIIRDDPNFSRAIFMRGKAKFALGAFKGTKNDMLEYIDQRGINQDVIEIMANTELKLNNDRNALSYLEILIKMEPYEGKHLAKAAQLSFDNNDRNRACEYWIQSAKLGDSGGTKKAALHCAYDLSIHLPEKPHLPKKKDDEILKKDDALVLENPNDVKHDSAIVVNIPEVIDVSVKTTTPYIDMDASQDVEIDDELTLTLNSGLGTRKIDDLPNILMLSDKSGRVVLDLCVDGGGKVYSVQLNSKLTTIFRSSLSSLAMRKAKQILFMPSLVENQCGLLLFN